MHFKQFFLSPFCHICYFVVIKGIRIFCTRALASVPGKLRCCFNHIALKLITLASNKWIYCPNFFLQELKPSHRRKLHKKSRIRETPTLLTDADSRTDTILEKLRDLYIYFIFQRLHDFFILFFYYFFFQRLHGGKTFLWGWGEVARFFL